MDNFASQIQAAKKAGYTEQEILDHLSKDSILGPQVQQAIKAGYSPAEIVAHVSQPPAKMDTALKYSAGSGIANLLDVPGRTLVNLANLTNAAYGVAKHKLTGSTDFPEMVDPNLLDFANPAARKLGLVDDRYAPSDPLGHVVDFTTQALTGGGINPNSIARSAARGMVKPIARDVIAATASGAGAGVGSQVASNVNTGNESVDNLAKIAATLTGGMVPGGLVAARGTAGDRVAAAIKGVTPSQMADAKVLAAKANAAGAPLTAYEAIQGITGLNPKMQTQQRVTEQSDAAAKGLTQMMQNRPKANATLVNKAVDTIAPAEQYPDVLAGRFKNTAEAAIKDARNQGNVAAQPHYAASSNNPANRIPASDWNALTSDDGVMAALEAVKKDPYAGLQNAADGSMSWLDQAKKHLDGQIESARRSGDSFAAKQMGIARDKILSVADAAYPDYAKARAIVADNMQNNVVPMQQGQVGKLSQSDDFKQQSETLLPNQPADVTPAVIDRTAQTIGAQDPDILKRFLAQDLRRKYAEASQRTMGGETTGGGAKFAATIAGNADQDANLKAAIQAAGAPTAPFNDAIDIFRAQGYKPGVNSATTANAAESGLMGGKSVVDMILKPFQAVPAAVDSWRNGWATKEMANALSAGPDTVQRIEELARANGVFSPMKQQMLINALLANQQN